MHTISCAKLGGNNIIVNYKERIGIFKRSFGKASLSSYRFVRSRLIAQLNNYPATGKLLDQPI
jgi:hypothetical protein